ncbi:MAG: cobalamin-dependent protein [Acidobacteriota bacterium]|nr:cobalamin-dependent protein [Acidobacteriota bacterium]
MSNPAGAYCARLIYRRRQELIDRIASRQGRDPLLASLTVPGTRGHDADDPGTHLSHLAEALAAGRSELFERYAAWAHVLITRVGARDHQLTRTLEAVRDVIEHRLPSEAGGLATQYLSRGLDLLRTEPADPQSLLDGSTSSAGLARRYLGALLSGDRESAARLMHDAAARAGDSEALLEGVLRPALGEIGLLWQTGKINVAKAHHATESTRLLIGQLRSASEAGRPNGRRVVACCVGGELHEIGVRIVADAFERAGWDAVCLGANTGLARLGAELRRERTDVLALSVTITANLRQVRRIIEEVREAEALADVRIVVGGQPFEATPGLWRSLGADGTAADASEAVRVCESQAVAPVT